MKNIKRLLLALVIVWVNVPAFADGDSTVLEPSQRGGFKVGINALYLRPTNSDLNFSTQINIDPSISRVVGEQNLTVETNYDGGVYGQIGYLFPCTSNDLTLGYTYLHSNESNLVKGVPAGSPITFVFSSPPILAGFASDDPFDPINTLAVGDRRGTAKFNLNVVDLEGGQRFISDNYNMRMFSGLRYANIGYALNTTMYPNPGFLLPDSYAPPSDIAFNSQFKGIGPRIGVDGRYSIGSNFGFDANISTTLLVGHLDSNFKANTNTRSAFDEEVANNHFESVSSSQTRIVPVLEGKLGIDYVYPINCGCDESVLIFEAGYQVTHYFNAVDHTRVMPLSSLPDLNPRYFNSQISTSDVGFDGIYLGVKYYV